MKLITKTLICALLFSLMLSLEAKKNKNAKNAPKEKPVVSFDGIDKLKYTTEQINSLVKTTEYKKATYTFSGGPYGITLPKDKKKLELLKKKYERRGETPFRICVSVTESKEYHGKIKKSDYTRGMASIYLIDMENKKVVEYKKVSLSKLCPT